MCKQRYTLFIAHAPINEDNRINPEKVEKLWHQLERELEKTSRMGRFQRTSRERTPVPKNRGLLPGLHQNIYEL